jgi:hypothetical protein
MAETAAGLAATFSELITALVGWFVAKLRGHDLSNSDARRRSRRRDIGPCFISRFVRCLLRPRPPTSPPESPTSGFETLAIWKKTPGGRKGQIMLARAMCGLLVAAAFAAGCGGGGGGRNDYPDEAVQSLMTSCTAQAGATESSCRCVLDNLQETISYEEFKRVDTAIRIGGTDEIPENSREKFLDAVSDCRG